jgi:hypothetical protein
MLLEDVVVAFEAVVPENTLALAKGKKANAMAKIANEVAMTAAANLAFIVHCVNLCNIRSI